MELSIEDLHVLSVGTICQLTHTPSGATVVCSTFKSLLRNKLEALRVLRAVLLAAPEVG